MDNLERKFAEILFDLVPNLVVVLDTKGKIVKFNKSCEILTGYTRDEVIGKQVFDLFIPEGQQEDVRSVFESLLIKQFPNNYANYWVTKKGEKRLISWYNGCITDDEGNIILIISSGTDITEVITLKKQERKTFEQLNLLENILSHDLRNYLVAIEGYINILEETRNLSLIEKIRTILTNCYRLVNDIEKRALKPIKIKSKTIKLSDVLNDLCERYNKVENINLIVHGDAEVLADAKLRSVFENLIHNAIKHGKAKNITINILEREKNIVVEILDDSQSIMMDIEKIQKELKSYQIEKTSGLGIVGKLLEIYEAKINITKNKNLGIKTIITFPKPENSKDI